QWTFIEGDVDFVGCRHIFVANSNCAGFRKPPLQVPLAFAAVSPEISLRFFSQPKTAARTRLMVCCAMVRAFFDPASMISDTRAGCFSYWMRRSRTGAIHWIK